MADHSEEARLKYTVNYGQEASVQPASAALTDPQIKHFSLTLEQLIRGSEGGTILDVGCGEGVLLRRLSDLDSFKNIPEWTYFGVDYEEKISKVLVLATALRIHRRVDAFTLDHFYQQWPALERPLIVVIRNVFHELNISATAQLIHSLAANVETNDTIIIQDLEMFPVAERGNACWTPACFQRMLERCGFEGMPVTEDTTHGNRWFTLVAFRNRQTLLSLKEIVHAVVKERISQYNAWTTGSDRHLINRITRPTEVELLDFDLQCAALHKQLLDAGAEGITAPTSGEQAKIANISFAKDLDAFDVKSLTTSIIPFERPRHFRDRQGAQDRLEESLRDDTTLTVVTGGAFIGKSALVQEVLSRRSHDRQPILIDAQFSSSVWNLLEQYFAGVGCKFSYSLLSRYTAPSFEHVRTPVTNLICKLSRHTIVVFDHFEKLLDPNGQISDQEVRSFVVALASYNDSKVIITSQRDLDEQSLPTGIKVFMQKPRMGRLPEEGRHVEYILDDFVDRAALKIEKYPVELLDAIDRHPLLAILSGKLIHKEGASSLHDESFLSLLRHKLRYEIVRRIVSEEAKYAIELLALVRVPIPKSMFIALAGAESVESAEELGLLYQVYDRRRRPLLSGMSVMRHGENDNAREDSEQKEPKSDRLRIEHKRIAEWYARLFREDEDPRWIREIHYHTILTRDSSYISRFGVAYRDELFWAGNYWFRVDKDFQAALWAFEAARALGLKTYLSELRLAACLLRVDGRKVEGEKLYNDLIARFPESIGPKSSYIDSLLFIRDYDKALAKLQEYEFSKDSDGWIAGQYGKSYFGIHQYKEAVLAFHIQIRLNPDSFAFWMLARAYYRMGDRTSVARTLDAGLAAYPTSRRLLLSYATHLISLRSSLSEAEGTLRELLATSSRDGAVLHQLCKLHCLSGPDGARKAEKLLYEIGGKVIPDRYDAPIKVEIRIAKSQWSTALDELRHSSPTDEHTIGLKKKIYLRWAQAEEDEIKRREIALVGLNVPMDQRLHGNIPLMVCSARLAKIAGEHSMFEDLLREIEQSKPSIAELLRIEGEDVDYWEDSYQE